MTFNIQARNVETVAVQVTLARHASPTAAVGPTSLSSRYPGAMPTPRDVSKSHRQPILNVSCLFLVFCLLSHRCAKRRSKVSLSRGHLSLFYCQPLLLLPIAPTGHSSGTQHHHHGGKGGRSVPCRHDAADRSVQYTLDKVSGIVPFLSTSTVLAS